MKRDKTLGKEECVGVLSLREAIRTIKTAILKSRYMAARQANLEHLKLYFNVGAYVSANSRDGTWNTAAIETISAQLARELPGLRGFSPTNMKNMRIFFENWALPSNRQLPTDDLTNIENAAIPAIRLSERNFYQKVTDIFATSVDYDRTNDITRTFFATVQNKLHFAAHRHTASELIYARVDANKPMVGMTHFEANMSI